MSASAIPICYVGEGLGSEATTPIPRLSAEVKWDKYERRVRMIPAAEAPGLLAEHPEDFRRCVPLADGYGGLSADELAALGADGKVHLETYYPKGGSDPVPMLVLDEITAAGLAVEKPAKKKKAGKE
jgi:hypothetical protein